MGYRVLDELPGFGGWGSGFRRSGGKVSFLTIFVLEAFSICIAPSCGSHYVVKTLIFIYLRFSRLEYLSRLKSFTRFRSPSFFIRYLATAGEPDEEEAVGLVGRELCRAHGLKPAPGFFG